jgi:hypothetical protein
MIYFAQIQDYRHESSMDYLVQEWQAITDWLKHRQQASKSEKRSFATCLGETFFSDKKRREKVSILHLEAFQAKDKQIQFAIDAKKELVDLHKLSRLVNYLPNLKLVFLSGYISRELVEQLLRMDIPAIVTVEANHVEAPVSPLTSRFYRGLAKGLSIREAFDQLTFNYGSSPKCYAVSYDLEKDQMMWEGKKQLKRHSPLPWGLYVMEDHLEVLNWTPPRRFSIPRRLRKVREPESKSQSIGYMLAGILFLTMAAGLLYSFYPHIFGS